MPELPATPLLMSATARLSLVGTSPALAALRTATAALAPSNVPVLIQGEAGTGAEEWAREIVRVQRQGDTLFVGELAADASEWVGGPPLADALRAVGDRGTSTLCIPAIERLPQRFQRQLERMLAAAAVKAGDRRCRVIATSNVALEERVRVGRFRRDLYHRVGAVQLNVPALRDRREDIAAIVDAYAGIPAPITASDPIAFGPDALAVLAAYDWPGNVAELVRTLEAARRTASGAITAKQIAAIVGGHWPVPPVGSVAPLRDVERDYLTMAVAQCRGNRTLAARLLGIARRTLTRKLREREADILGPA